MIGINSNADLHLDHVTLKLIMIMIYFLVTNTVTSFSYYQANHTKNIEWT